MNFKHLMTLPVIALCVASCSQQTNVEKSSSEEDKAIIVGKLEKQAQIKEGIHRAFKRVDTVYMQSFEDTNQVIMVLDTVY